MALTKSAAKAACIGLVGLILSASTPHFEARDMTNPMLVAEKMKYDQGVQYGLGYAAMMGGLVSAAYLAARGKATK